MATGKKNKVEKIEFGNVVWCIDNLSTKQLELHDKKPYSGEDLLEKVHELVEADFKVGVKQDTYSGGYLATAICDVVGSRNEALALSARGEDISDCLSIVVFKYFDVAKGDLRPFAEKPRGIRG